MNESFKQTMTTSFCIDPKGFTKEGNCKVLQTKTYDTETKTFVCKYPNTHSLFLSNSNYSQIGCGLTHCQRGAYVVDSDTEITPQTLHYIYETFFVEPSVILYNPTSHHTQTFFFFDKDVQVYKYTKGQKLTTKNHNIYMDNLHTLNSFMNIGDTHYTGFWCKNPYNDNFETLFETNKTYSFKVLNTLIEQLDKNKTFDSLVGRTINWETPKNNYTELLVKSINEPTELYDTHTYTITKEEFSLIKTEETNTTTNTEPQKKIDPRGKFKEGSENRHSTLFELMKNTVMIQGKVDTEYLINLCRIKNQEFNKPLTENELLNEVCNETTMKKTLETLVHWQKYKEDMSEKCRELVVELLQNNDIEIVKETLLNEYKWSNYMVEKYTDGDVKLGKYKDERKRLVKYNYDYSKYDSVKRNKMVIKTRKWLKSNNWSLDFPKKWNDQEREIAMELINNN